MKKCEQYQMSVSALIDNELDDGSSSELFSHMSRCRECREFMNALLELRSGIQETAISITEDRKKSPLLRRMVSISYPLAAVISLMVMVSLFLLFRATIQQPKIVEKTKTEYVYMTSFPPVYAKLNSTDPDIKSN